MDPLAVFEPATWLGTLVFLAIALVVAAVVVVLIRVILAQLARRTPWVAELGRRIRASLVAVAIVIAVAVVASLTAPAQQIWWPRLSHALLILAIIVGAWFVSSLVSFGFERLIAREEVIVGANARRRRTQLVVIHRLILAVIAVLMVSAVLFSFPQMRVIGTSLLASAGIISIVAGLAAQSILGNLIAGIQLAFTDAIKVDDIVVVEGEWGRIGEIRLSYVVLYTWDERRVILPCTYFTTTPFETWTRESDNVYGLVLMDLDWRVRMEPLRAKFQEIIEQSAEWDRRVASANVIEAQGGYVTVRFTVSAANATDQFALRYKVREGIMTWLQQEHPEALPTTRYLGEKPGEGMPATRPEKASESE